MSVWDKLFGDKGKDDPWKTRMVKDIHNPFRRYMGEDLQSTSDAVGGQNLFSDPWSYATGDRKIVDSGDVWQALGRVSSTGDTSFSKRLDENSRKYAGPAIMSAIGNIYSPEVGALAGAAAAGLGQKLSGESDKDAGKAAGITAVLSYLGSGLGSMFGGGGGSGGSAASGAGGTSGAATGAGSSAASSAGSGAATGVSDVSGRALYGTAPDTASTAGGGLSGFLSQNPDIWNVLAQMGTNTSQGQPTMQGVGESMYQSRAAAKQANAQQTRRNKLIENIAKALEKSGLNTDLTPDDQDGPTDFTLRAGPDGRYKLQLTGSTVESAPEGSIMEGDDGNTYIMRGEKWQKRNY